MQLGQYDDARNYFAAAVALNPEVGETRFLLGRELGRKGDNPGAAEQFAAAVRLLPDVIEARLNLALR